MTIEDVEKKTIELIHREPLVPFVFEMDDGHDVEVFQPGMSIDFTGAGFIGPDGGLVDVEFKNVRATRLLNSKTLA